MSKVIMSPIEKWPGSVTIADPLTIPQARLIEAGMEKPEEDATGTAWLSITDENHEPAVLACVEKWNLENFHLTTQGTLPASPRKDSHRLTEWLFREIVKVYLGEVEIPNGSSPTPISTPAAAGTAEDITAPK